LKYLTLPSSGRIVRLQLQSVLDGEVLRLSSARALTSAKLARLASPAAGVHETSDTPGGRLFVLRLATVQCLFMNLAKVSDVTLPSEVAYEGSATRNVAQRAWCELLSSLPDLQ
jgi:hypothetical protein